MLPWTMPIQMVMAQVEAAGAAAGGGAGIPAPNETPMGLWIAMLAFMALAPFLFTLITSFAKLVIIGGILRQAMGTPQIPPNTVITGLALILTLHIMSPVVIDAYQRYQQQEKARETALAAMTPEERASAEKARTSMVAVREVLDAVEPSIRGFLERHAHREHVQLFEQLDARLQAANPGNQPLAQLLGDDASMQQVVRDLIVLAPAFMLSELVEAFQIGFLIFVPFLVIDLVVSNVLLAMGMHMLSPVTISMPFKLLLFVLIDGWTLIIQGVVLNYA